MHRFESFDSDIRACAVSRRKKEFERVDDLRQRMVGLRKGLAEEKERREAMDACRRAEFDVSVRNLRSRLAAIKAIFNADCCAIPVDIERRGRELGERLTQSAEDFAAETEYRSRRERTISSLIADQESDSEKRFEDIRDRRETNYDRLRALLEEHLENTDKRSEKTNAVISNSVAKIHNAIIVETTTRKREDIELNDAIDTYIAKLQQTLKLCNSDSIENNHGKNHHIQNNIDDNSESPRPSYNTTTAKRS